jgi:acetoin utilization deacetylase AcuC-like enzyme
MNSSRPILLVEDPIFALHRPAQTHPESPARQDFVRGAVLKAETAGIAITSVGTRSADELDILRVHTPVFWEALSEKARKFPAGTMLDADTYMGERSFEVARLAAGSAVHLVQRQIEELSRGGFLMARPPGHHATPERSMGFCILNNAAIAAAYAQATLSKRVAVVDIDVHHGNGTQDAFYTDPNVLYLSLHQRSLYPGTGQAHEAGAGPGLGLNVNLPLSEGSNDAVYEKAMREVVLPILAEFGPSFIVVSAGYDAAVADPLGGMQVTRQGFRQMTQALTSFAEATCPGQILFCLEGGYHGPSLQDGVYETLQAMSGVEAEPAAKKAPATDPALLTEVGALRSVHAKHWRSLRS